MSIFHIKDRVLFITGTSRERGIGHALVEESISRGAKKVYATARNISELNNLVKKHPDKIIPVQLDVTSQEQIQDATQKAKDVDVLINNAGIASSSGCVYNYNEKAARQELEVNYLAPLHLIKAFSKSLIQNKGAIVNIISIGGLYPSPTHVTYSASKAAVYSLTQAIRIEMAMHAHAVTVFGVYPGPIDTDMADGLEVKKESPTYVAQRVFDNMENGILDITTDSLSDNFQPLLRKDHDTITALKRAFRENTD